MICFSYESYDFAHFVISLPSLDMPYDQHGWNLILFKGQKYRQVSLAYCLKDKNIVKFPWLILFLYSKTSVQNSFLECPIVFVCDL